MKKICVMHQASIGDMLIATPVYRAAKECFPSAKLIVVTSKIGYEMLCGNPHIDELVAYEKGDSVFSLIKKIWRSDVAIILDYHYRNALYAFLAGIRRRIGRGKDFVNERVVENFPEDVFEVQRDLNVSSKAGITTDDLRLVPLVITGEDKQRVDDVCEELNINCDKFVVIAPFSLSHTKDWEPHKYRVIIDRLQNLGYDVVGIGGADQVGTFEQEFPGIKILSGKTNIRETAEVISRAKLQICGCTAMLHVCSTTNTPSVAIYGPTLPERWAPKGNCTVITRGFGCSPCYHDRPNACKDNQCIKQITVDEVWEAVLKNLH